MKPANFNLQRAVAYCCHKQHILPGSQAASILDVASTLVGIHAARLITPYFALRARLKDLRHDDIHDALYRSKTLIKARCMRGTLHLLPHHVFVHAHHATLSRRLGVCHALHRKHGIGAAAVEEISGAVMLALKNGPVAASALPDKARAHLQRAHSKQDAGWPLPVVRNVVKELWERGSVCYINTDQNFGAEQRSYAIRHHIYPPGDQAEPDQDKALSKLLEAYILAYGPVTVDDMAWWSGLDKTRIKRAMTTFSEALIELTCAEFDAAMWMFRDDFATMTAFPAYADDWAALLAYEDPSLKGYFSTRGRYVDPEHYKLLFNDIGEARPSIMLNGRIAGTWSLNKTTGAVDSTLFAPLNKAQRKLVENELAKVRANAIELLRPAGSRDLFE